MLAPYEPRTVGAKPDTDETTMMSPRPRGTIAPSAACESRSTAVQLRWNIRSWSASGVSQNFPASPIPALFTSRSTGRSTSDSRVRTVLVSASTARSAGSTSTSTPCADRSGGGGALQPVHVPGDDDQVLPLGGELPGERRADPGRGPGDERGHAATAGPARKRFAGSHSALISASRRLVSAGQTSSVCSVGVLIPYRKPSDAPERLVRHHVEDLG